MPLINNPQWLIEEIINRRYTSLNFDKEFKEEFYKTASPHLYIKLLITLHDHPKTNEFLKRTLLMSMPSILSDIIENKVMAERTIKNDDRCAS